MKIICLYFPKQHLALFIWRLSGPSQEFKMCLPRIISLCAHIFWLIISISYAWPMEISGRLNMLSSFRYFQPPASWIQCALESRELLALCLKKIKAPLSKVGGMVTTFIFRKSFCVEFALFWCLFVLLLFFFSFHLLFGAGD